MSRRLVHVYHGIGRSDESLHMLLTSLRRHLSGSSYSVRTITPEQILQGAWEKSTAVLAIGGGYDRGFLKALGDRGVALIRQFVHQGGAYLGICAGGYFGCDFVEFDKGGPLEVCGHRGLKFYPGKCVGPVFPGFKYGSQEGAHAASVQMLDHDQKPSSSPFTCYFNGGGYFSYDKPWFPERCQSLARYAENKEYRGTRDAPSAVVQCWSGKGTAILTGIHIEYIVDELDQRDSRIRDIAQDLHKGQESCEKVFVDILKRLGVDADSTLCSKL